VIRTCLACMGGHPSECGRTHMLTTSKCARTLQGTYLSNHHHTRAGPSGMVPRRLHVTEAPPRAAQRPLHVARARGHGGGGNGWPIYRLKIMMYARSIFSRAAGKQQ
jgi:hypothetical protein